MEGRRLSRASTSLKRKTADGKTETRTITLFQQKDEVFVLSVTTTTENGARTGVASDTTINGTLDEAMRYFDAAVAAARAEGFN